MTLWFCQRNRRTGIVRRLNLDDLPNPTICATGTGDALADGYWLEDDGMARFYRSDNPNGFKTGKRFSLDESFVTMMAAGAGGNWFCHWHVEPGEDMAAPRANEPGKPPYRVPTMAEVRATPWNGFTVATTFAGCGGSSLGYRMAGYRVLWASEFVPAAQDSYRANMGEHTVLDGRDVREVKPEEILAALGFASGDLDVLDGSPPCQAFSTAGSRAKGWGKDKQYEHGAKQKNEELFTEYIRLLRGLMPRAFVAENVSGLVKGAAKGFFLEVLAGLKGCGYRVEARLLDAQWLGVPQVRQRVIFVGVREDLGLAPAFPSPLSYRYSVRDAIPWISAARSGASGFGAGTLSAGAPAPTVPSTIQAPYGDHSVERVVYDDGRGGGPADVSDRPAPTVIVGPRRGRQHIHWRVDMPPTEKRKFTIAELKRICAFPDDFVLTGSYAQQWARLGNSVPPLMMRAVAETLRDRVLLPARSVAGRSNTATPCAPGTAHAASRPSSGAGPSRA